MELTVKAWRTLSQMGLVCAGGHFPGLNALKRCPIEFEPNQCGGCFYCEECIKTHFHAGPITRSEDSGELNF